MGKLIQAKLIEPCSKELTDVEEHSKLKRRISNEEISFENSKLQLYTLKKIEEKSNNAYKNAARFFKEAEMSSTDDESEFLVSDNKINVTLARQNMIKSESQSLTAKEKVKEAQLRMLEMQEELQQLQHRSNELEREVNQSKSKCDVAKEKYGHGNATLIVGKKMEEVRFNYKLYAMKAAQEAALKSVYYVAKTKKTILDAENQAINSLKLERKKEVKKVEQVKQEVEKKEEEEEEKASARGSSATGMTGGTGTGTTGGTGMTGVEQVEQKEKKNQPSLSNEMRKTDAETELKEERNEIANEKKILKEEKKASK